MQIELNTTSNTIPPAKQQTEYIIETYEFSYVQESVS